MTTICEGVTFDTIAREWRMKWSEDNDKASLVALQKLIDEVKPALKEIKGLQGVQRMVCGECKDLRLIVRVEAGAFKEWAETSFGPEETFLSKAKEIEGVSQIETQTYTLMPVEL
ncbi:Hypothetical Protein FCC1311_049812 [Hondaea fermentalgiana]|uniref:Uncharacterized protein n=1 Tax=Hondaea fermentalgiana TaxID=2315210 RepID=A0A2R5GCR2_9STRA|nr:Hypothetical Protein FCC1311_049812 [Hondaea fermentalgiana]|eukprot:GBG28760.1 Hypothetical Protein FCC1311_049812 [Hondaea fermentalgiana]